MSWQHLSADRFLDLVDGALSADQEAQVREHLAQCRSCAARYREQREVRATLRVADAPAPDASLLAGLLSLETGNRLGGGALLPGPAFGAVTAPVVVAGGSVTRPPDTARWMFTAALAGGVSLVALGGASALSASSGAPLPTAKSIVQGVPGQSWASLVSDPSGRESRDDDR